MNGGRYSMQFVVEYLVIVPKSESFCDSVEAFNRLLEVDSLILINKDRIHYRDNIGYKYEITGNEVTGKEQRYFHLRFTIDKISKDENECVEGFTAFLKNIRSIVMRLGGQVETLWDDISFYYSQKAYPIIYEIENLMRKLIANFMLITIGKDWISETSPSEVQEVINRSKRKDYVNVLHAVDFIDLASFLTKPYSKKSAQELYNKLKKAQSLEEYQELKEYIPSSNWQRYFSALVACEDTYLSKRWEDLYDLRCKVAHNAIVMKADFERILSLANDLREKLIDALAKLPQVEVPKSEREYVAENAVTNLGGIFGDFIVAWRLLEQRLITVAARYGTRQRNGRAAIEILLKEGVISSSQYDRFVIFNQTRNGIVHSASLPVPLVEIRQQIDEMLDLAESFTLTAQEEVDELFPD